MISCAGWELPSIMIDINKINKPAQHMTGQPLNTTTNKIKKTRYSLII